MIIRPSCITLIRFLYLITGAFTAIAVSTAVAAPQSADSTTSSHWRSPGKPNAGLALVSGSEYQMAPGRVQSLTLELASRAQEGVLRVVLTTSDPQLELLSPPSYEIDLAQEPEPALAVELLPHNEGRFYLMLNAELVREGLAPQAQSLGVVVQVGKKRTDNRSLKGTSAPGVISLPAQESIRQH